MIPSYYKRQSYALSEPGGTNNATYSTAITSTVNTHLRGTLFDYVTQPYAGGNRPGNFSSITWTSVGTFTFNTPVNTTTLWSQNFPNAIYSGTNDNHVIYASRALIWPRQYTIMFRFKMDTVFTSGTPSQTLFANGDVNTTGTHIWLVFQTPSTKLNILTSGNANIAGPALNANQWYHLAVCGTVGRNVQFLYVDGVSYGGVSQGFPSLPNLTSTVSLFGGGYTGANRFLGAITDFTILNRCITAEQAYSYYLGGFV